MTTPPPLKPKPPHSPERLRVMKRALAHIVEHTLDDPNCWGNLKYLLFNLIWSFAIGFKGHK